MGGFSPGGPDFDPRIDSISGLAHDLPSSQLGNKANLNDSVHVTIHVPSLHGPRPAGPASALAPAAALRAKIKMANSNSNSVKAGHGSKSIEIGPLAPLPALASASGALTASFAKRLVPPAPNLEMVDLLSQDEPYFTTRPDARAATLVINGRERQVASASTSASGSQRPANGDQRVQQGKVLPASQSKSQANTRARAESTESISYDDDEEVETELEEEHERAETDHQPGAADVDADL